MVSLDTAKLSAATLVEAKAARREQNQWHNAEEIRRILNWLSSLSFESKQADVLSKSHPGTGQWMLKSDRFIAWRDEHSGSPPVLWCPGIRKNHSNCCTVRLLIEHQLGLESLS